MKLLFGFLFLSLAAKAQLPPLPASATRQEKIHTVWKLNGNKMLTGGLVVLAGAAKGFNETLTFHWKKFHYRFPDANVQWFNPAISWRNKYKDGIAANGPKFTLSNSVLVMTTDQYHLNNFIGRAAWISAIVIKIGEGKKPLKYYLKDILYYSVCHQLGFGLMYYPFSKAHSGM